MRENLWLKPQCFPDKGSPPEVWPWCRNIMWHEVESGSQKSRQCRMIWIIAASVISDIRGGPGAALTLRSSRKGEESWWSDLAWSRVLLAAIILQAGRCGARGEVAECGHGQSGRGSVELISASLHQWPQPWLRSLPPPAAQLPALSPVSHSNTAALLALALGSRNLSSFREFMSDSCLAQWSENRVSLLFRGGEIDKLLCMQCCVADNIARC